MGCTCPTFLNCSSDDANQIDELDLDFKDEVLWELVRNTVINNRVLKDSKNSDTNETFIAAPHGRTAVIRVPAKKSSTPKKDSFAILMPEKEYYKTLINTMARLSVKDVTKLNSSIINSNSVYNVAKLHRHGIDSNIDSKSDDDEEKKHDNDIKEDDDSTAIDQYTNEKGYCKVLHLIKHGKTAAGQYANENKNKNKNENDSDNKDSDNKDSYSYSYYIETRLLNGMELFDHYAEATLTYKAMKNIKFCCKVIKDLLYAVKYFHDRQIIHRNIKLENVKFDIARQSDNINEYYKESNLVLIGYAASFCFDLNNIKNDSDEIADVMVGTPSYCPPELSFGILYKKYKLDYGDKADIGSFIAKMKKKRLDNWKLSWETGRYSCEKLFGMSWKERYKQWKNYDTLPIYENDDPNKDLFERFVKRTPRMMKAGDIWCVGIIAYQLMTGRMPFGYGTDSKIKPMEEAVTKEYLFPATHHTFKHKMTKDTLPLSFRVEYMMALQCLNTFYAACCISLCCCLF